VVVVMEVEERLGQEKIQAQVVIRCDIKVVAVVKEGNGKGVDTAARCLCA
jgi:hypothetical protein